jgi:Ca2+-transporting ATPase
MENFEDKINLMLLAACVVSLIIGYISEPMPEGLIEGTSIAFALLIIVSVNSINNYISERRLADLVKQSNKQDVAVYRNSDKTVTIDGDDLVVGDLFYFEQGMKMPCDAIMVDGQDVTCVEGELTGEPDAFEKVRITEDNYKYSTTGTLLAKSTVQSGFGTALAMAVGKYTAAGVIVEKTQGSGTYNPETKKIEPVEIDTQTVLQKKLAVMADKIGDVGFLCAGLTLFSMIVRIAIEMMEIVPCGCANIFYC